MNTQRRQAAEATRSDRAARWLIHAIVRQEHHGPGVRWWESHRVWESATRLDVQAQQWAKRRCVGLGLVSVEPMKRPGGWQKVPGLVVDFDAVTRVLGFRRESWDSPTFPTDYARSCHSVPELAPEPVEWAPDSPTIPTDYARSEAEPPPWWAESLDEWADSPTIPTDYARNQSGLTFSATEHPRDQSVEIIEIHDRPTRARRAPAPARLRSISFVEHTKAANARVREASEAGDERTDTAPTLGTRADAPFDPDAYRATLPARTEDALATLCRRRITLLRMPPSSRKRRGRSGWAQRYLGELDPEGNAARDLLRALWRLDDGPQWLDRPDVLAKGLRRAARGSKALTSPALSLARDVARFCRFAAEDAEAKGRKRERRQCGKAPGEFTAQEFAELSARMRATMDREVDPMAL